MTTLDDFRALWPGVAGLSARRIEHHSRRRARLKAVFEGRKKVLDGLWAKFANGGSPNPAAYSRAVIKYQKARKAWRAFRGWE